MFLCILTCNGLSNDDVGVSRGTVFPEIAALKNGDVGKEKLGGVLYNDS